MKRILFITLTSFFFWQCRSTLDSSYVDTITKTEDLSVHNGVFSGTLSISDSLIGAPFATGTTMDVTLTRSNFVLKTTYKIFEEDEDDDQTCELSATLAEYQAQPDCYITTDEETEGDVQVSLDTFGIDLPVSDYDDYNEFFYYDSEKYSFILGDEHKNTNNALNNPIRVVITKMDLLLEDATATIDY